MLPEDSSPRQQQASGFDHVRVIQSESGGIRQGVAQRQVWFVLARGHSVQSTADGKQGFVGYEGSY